MAIYRTKKFTSPKKWAGRGPPGPIGSAANGQHRSDTAAYTQTDPAWEGGGVCYLHSCLAGHVTSRRVKDKLE